MPAANCEGCGAPLGPPSPRGRPARYHGPACRQRAHRARLRAQASNQDWVALDEVDAAIADLRRRMATGRDPRPALARLLTAALGIANVHDVLLSNDPPGCARRSLLAVFCDPLAIGDPPSARDPRLRLAAAVGADKRSTAGWDKGIRVIAGGRVYPDGREVRYWSKKDTGQRHISAHELCCRSPMSIDCPPAPDCTTPDCRIRIQIMCPVHPVQGVAGALVRQPRRGSDAASPT